ncbi:MAG TPA: DoxX family protein [Chloroflexota bacterium]|nr:DoxX family protein [Chloroflexota bacterium]
MDLYRRLVSPMPLSADWGLAALRVVVGLTFLLHGWQKLFQFGVAGTAAAFAQMGVPLPGLTAPLVSVLELVGGALVLLGLATRPAAVVLAIDVLAAILLVHRPAGFFAPNGVELPLLLLAGAVALTLAGPGALALDRVLARPERGAPASEQQVASGWSR